MNVLSRFCQSKTDHHVFPYQVQISNHIFDNLHNIPLRFGTAMVGNVLRPFVYFTRGFMPLHQFIDNNPVLGEVHT